MGVLGFPTKFISIIPPAKAFKALVLDFNHIVPQAAQEVIRSIDLLEGDGGPGSVKQINFADGKK